MVDNSEQKKPIALLNEMTTLERHRCEIENTSSMGCLRADDAPGWWFQYFEPVWGPFMELFRCHRHVTMTEFERAASQVGLTQVEKTIAISAFRQQQDGAISPRATTAFRREHILSAV